MPDQTIASTDSFLPPAHISIAVIGLGYIGLPLAVEFAKKVKVIGFDIKQSRLDELNRGFDRTLEIDEQELKIVIANNGLKFASNAEAIHSCNIYIIAVPTPTDRHNRPDLTLLKKASETVGKVLCKGDVVIYESTVYPGATEEVCIPILQQASGLQYNFDFFAGYSPERINPGDKVHTLTNILKVTSGSTPRAADFIDDLYRLVVTAGTHKAPSIKVAEACKVIENSQRDINIAFVNELAKIFNIMGIDTHAVLEAAGTKWNFLKFKPGLVGGHCTGVDPYYLAQKAQEVGYHPEIILAGRRLNDGMGTYVAQEVVKLMIKKDIAVKNADILILGFTFKENCPDVRNTRVIDIITALQEYGASTEIYDPWADKAEVRKEYGIDTINSASQLRENYDVIIVAVAHNEFGSLNYAKLKKSNGGIIYDLKGILPNHVSDARL
ncbi:nucleotide sugar dehydrogenase [Mucilaginibacter mali]|uniref:Nucleotide sugar dehydrogenase n=1 Tax=Mucilaginibacter mali TaxID=2740462 RepID=A0A7D4Q247_9SPHI|nr:nucleotide sugar dehydrogenase [Mucilaginibacter mali]QKJ29387.1 nucleotide sugar dehydrogenase [Mucilaginibacter mali]